LKSLFQKQVQEIIQLKKRVKELETKQTSTAPSSQSVLPLPTPSSTEPIVSETPTQESTTKKSEPEIRLSEL